MDEFRLIDEFLRPFRAVAAPRGPGDDCAVLAPTALETCVTTDALVEGVHFTRASFPLEDIGYKALATNLSDLASMGARPAWMLCALGLPPAFSPSAVARLARGMAALANAEGVALLGGNVTRASQLTVTLTLGGLVPRGRRPLLRSGARPGELVYLVGAVGDAAAGLRVLQGPRARRSPLAQRLLVAAQRRPVPQLSAGLLISPFASACIDVSDGVLQDLGHLCDASGVGADLESPRVPISDGLLAETGSRRAALVDALAGGEDYALLFTVAPSRRGRLEAALRQGATVAVAIGRTTISPGVRVDGRVWKARRGFRHFS